MMSLSIPSSGLILSQPLERSFRTAPLADGKAVSWLAWARYGDDQGNHGACVPFAAANWAELVARALPAGLTTGRGVVHGIEGGRNITNDETIKAYYSATDGIDEGMIFPDGYRLAKRLAWIRDSVALQAVATDDRLIQQPLLVGMEITEDWTRAGNVGADGKFRKTSSTRSLGYHAVVMIGKGSPPAWGTGTWVYLLTPWRLDDGAPWGWNGVAVLPAEYVADWMREAWAVV
jgi:hypothetical protein